MAAPEGEDPNPRKTSEEDDESTEIVRRLVVELNRKSSSDLAWLTEYESLTKTTVVNRAIQVYKMVVELQSRDGRIIIDDPVRKGPETLRIM